MTDLLVLLGALRTEVEQRFAGEGTGHDWAHIQRVHDMACYIAKREGGDLCITSMGALLHDIADHKFFGGDLSEGPRQSRELVLRLGGSRQLADRLAQLVSEVSFKGAGVDTPVSTVEAAAVQDADRLDAIGAIGVARAFAYGGSKGRPLHVSDVPPEMHTHFESYAKSENGTINHFYEKLLLLKDRLHTDTARRIAESRHTFMDRFLDQFLLEWDGKDYQGPESN